MPISQEKQVVITTLDEIIATQAKLGLGQLVDADERAEAWFIIERIERRLAAAKAEEATL